MKSAFSGWLHFAGDIFGANVSNDKIRQLQNGIFLLTTVNLQIFCMYISIN
jgi:hypothetical protein